MSIISRITGGKSVSIGAILTAKADAFDASAHNNAAAAKSLAQASAEAAAQAELDKKHAAAFDEALRILDEAGVPLDT